jgi:hypothetical protein
MNNPDIRLPNRATVLSGNLNRARELLRQRIAAYRQRIRNQLRGGYGGWPMPPRPRWLERQENGIVNAQNLIAEINKAYILRHMASNLWAGGPRPRRHFKPSTLREIERLERHTAFNIPAWTTYHAYRQALARKLKIPSLNALQKLINENKLARNAIGSSYFHKWAFKLREPKFKRNALNKNARMAGLKRKRNNNNNKK